VLVALKNGDELRTLASTDTLSVLVTNTTDAAKTITVDLYARRLSGASQTTSLAPVTVPARGTATIPVAVKSLPNRRNGTSQTYAIAARYSDAGGARIDPGPAFAVGWDAAFGNAWVGHEIHAPEVGRRAFAALAARAGRNVPNDLEGRARLVAALQTGADVEDIDARSGARSLRKATVDEPWAVPVADSEAKLAATALSAKAPAGPNTAAMALGVPIVAPIFWKACFQFDVNGLYRDASGGNQTAYVNGLTPAAGVSLSAAWADSGSGGSASGYLDADGCFSFTFQNGKPSSISLWSSLGSFGPPGQPLNATGAKFTIFPAGENYFSPTLGTVSSFIPKSIPTQTFTLPGTEAARVGAILSRIYRMPDNGLGLGTASVWSVPGKIYIRPYLSTSQIDADGWNFLCKPYPLTAGGLGYGEACANPGYGQVSFGPLLAKTGGTDAAPTYSGISIPGFSTASYPLSLTTIDRSAIAHEIGHYVQAKMAGFLDSTYPTTSNSVTNDPDNLCSCNQVGEGNRRHCLQNRMGFAPAFNEGFGHYYAARVLNEDRTGTPSVATSCNFPYYKNVKFPLNPATPSVNQITSAPPVPVQCSAPRPLSRRGEPISGEANPSVDVAFADCV
jgi:hypothetical protein